MAISPPGVRCRGCGKAVEILELYPKMRCLDCHAADPKTIEETENMTADKLARMWGG